MNENKGKKIIEKGSTPTPTPSNNYSSDMRKKLIKLIVVIGGFLVVLLIIMFVLSLFKSHNLSYEEIETKMEKAAEEYYQVQKDLLPQEEGQTVEVDASTLVASDYMKPLKELKKDAKCTGKVLVQKVNNKFVYTAQLDCGSDYSTKELYQAITDQGIVTSGNGLYEMNGELVYRGEYVNNYIQLDKQLFQIVRAKADHSMLIIPILEKGESYSWDDRYNEDRGYNTGINNYRISRIYEYLQSLYNNTNDNLFLSENDKKKLISFPLCIGKKEITNTNNTNAIECSDVLENQMIGLLTVSDYVNASIDSNCQSGNDKACQNYNYLKTDLDWWTLTGNAANTYQVIYVNRYGYADVSGASNAKKIRPVFMLNNRVMIKSGSGSKSDPYILK